MAYPGFEIAVNALKLLNAVQQLTSLSDVGNSTVLVISTIDDQLVLSRGYGEARIPCEGHIPGELRVSRREQKKWMKFRQMATEVATLKYGDGMLKVPGCSLEVKFKRAANTPITTSLFTERSIVATTPASLDRPETPQGLSLRAILEFAICRTTAEISATGMTDIVTAAQTTAENLILDAVKALRPLEFLAEQIRSLLPKPQSRSSVPTAEKPSL